MDLIVNNRAVPATRRDKRIAVSGSSSSSANSVNSGLSGLAIASLTSLGAIIVGANLFIDPNGVLSANAPYTHPDTHPASIISQNSTNRFVTDVQITNWNNANAWGNHALAGYAKPLDITTAINNLISSAPGALDTLNELATALGDDPNFATTVNTAIGLRLLSSDFTNASVLAKIGYTPYNPASYPVNMNGETLDSVLTRGNSTTKSIVLSNAGKTFTLSVDASGNLVLNGNTGNASVLTNGDLSTFAGANPVVSWWDALGGFVDGITTQWINGKIVSVASGSGAVDVNVSNLNNYYTKLTSDARFKAIGYFPTWSEVTGKPTALSYFTNDSNFISGITKAMIEAQLTGAITTHNHAYANLTGLPTLFNGAYGSLSGLPTLFNGVYGSLTGIPSTFAPSAHSHAYSSLTGLPTLFNGVYGSLSGLPSLFDGNYNSLSNKPTIPTSLPTTQALTFAITGGASPGAVFNGGTAIIIDFHSVGACASNDGRLSNDRNAADVWMWAKQSVKPSYVWSEIGSKPTVLSAFTNDLGNYGSWITGINSTMIANALGYTPLATRTFGSAANNNTGDFQPIENQRLSTGNAPTFNRVTASEFIRSDGANVWHSNNNLRSFGDADINIDTFSNSIWYNILHTGGAGGGTILAWAHTYNLASTYGGAGLQFNTPISAANTVNSIRVRIKTEGGWNSWNNLYHSGNSNLISVDWSAKNIFANGIYLDNHILNFDQSGVRSWQLGQPQNGNFYFNSGDGSGIVSFNTTIQAPRINAPLNISQNTGASRLPSAYADQAVSPFWNDQMTGYEGVWMTGLTLKGIAGSDISWQLFSRNSGTAGVYNELFWREGTSSWSAVNRIWHSGNSNRSDINWLASKFTIGDGNNELGRIGATSYLYGNSGIKLQTYNGGVIDAVSISSTGNLTALGEIVAFSDIRLKTNIKPLANSLEKILALNSVSFNWKSDLGRDTNTNQLGYIAQEVQKIIPEIVVKSGDYLGVAYIKVIPVITDAIKVLNDRIITLETEVKELKERVN